MKKALLIFCTLCYMLLLHGCHSGEALASVVATTKPVYDFTQHLCRGTSITVDRLITENLSCIHDYTLQVRQMRAIENADVVIISGAGLEDFMADALESANNIIDASDSIPLLCADHGSEPHGDHHHDEDPHIWMDITNARTMATNICLGLIKQYPEQESLLKTNLLSLESEFNALQEYGSKALSGISHRQLITFHDGFHYFSDCWDLELLHAVEEEPGSEASAGELIDIIELINNYDVPAIFTEVNGSTSASGIISAETGIPVYSLSTCMSDADYFEAMRKNIDTIKEALE